jgi:hypothetical protein
LSLYPALAADPEPVFLVYAGGGAASEAVAAVDARKPLVDANLPDGLRHRLWALTDPAELAAVAADLHTRSALIADGHHRFATYLQRQEAAHAQGLAPGPWDFGLALLVDSTAFGPEVHPIHRVVTGVEAAALAERATGSASVDELDGQGLEAGLAALAEAGARGSAFLLVSGDGTTMRLLSEMSPPVAAAAFPEGRSAAWRALDVSLLHHYLVPHVWAFRTTPRRSATSTTPAARSTSRRRRAAQRCC